MSACDQLAEQICETGWRLYERGFIAATEGNISCRLPDGDVLCTPTTISKGHMSPADLCVVDAAGNHKSGNRTRTSEILLHVEVYRNNPQSGAVVHCHPPHATAFAVSAAPLPSGILAETEYFLGDIPSIEYRTPGTAGFAELIAAHARTSRCAILKNHGAISWDDTLERARCWIEVLDAYCRTIILARGLGELASLSEADVAELRRLGKR